MWKKIGIGLAALTAGLIVFVYVQLGIAQKDITQLLNRHDIQLDELNIGVFPPALKLQRLKFTHSDVFVQVKSVEVLFNPLFLAVGKLGIEDIILTDGAIYQERETKSTPDYQVINLSLKPTALYTEDIPELFDFAKHHALSDELAARFAPKISVHAQNSQHDNIMFFIDSHITPRHVSFSPLKIKISPAKTVYQHQQQFDLTIEKGVFSKISDFKKGYEILADGWSLNGEHFGTVKSKMWAPEQQRKHYVVSLSTDVCHDCMITVELEKTASKQRKLTLHSEYFPLEKLLKAFQLPVFATGKGEVRAELDFNGLQPQKGKFFINMQDGKIQGLNILRLIGQYLPINYQVDNEMKTDYEHFSAQFDWDQNNIDVSEIYLRSKVLLIEGEGSINVNNMQCSVTLTIGVNDPKYRQLKLPMRFFDNCYSPQYKIDVDRGFREQLKNYLKQRIN